MLNRVSFVLYFKSNATANAVEATIQRLALKQGVAFNDKLQSQFGGRVHEFQVSDAWADSFQDAVRGEKTIREFGRSDRQES